MAFQDLREYLDAVEKVDELKVVRGADLATDVGSITEITAWSPEHPLVVFDEIPGYRAGTRVAVHAFDSYRRMQLIYGFPDGLRGPALTAWWKDRLDDYVPAPPVEVETGPVMQNLMIGDDVDLNRFPAPRWHARDGAPYLATGGASVLRDPDTGHLNAGCYRGMLYDRNTIGHHLAGGHNGQVIRDKYFARGENCPVVISARQRPLLHVGRGRERRVRAERAGVRRVPARCPVRDGHRPDDRTAVPRHRGGGAGGRDPAPRRRAEALRGPVGRGVGVLRVGVRPARCPDQRGLPPRRPDRHGGADAALPQPRCGRRVRADGPPPAPAGAVRSRGRPRHRAGRARSSWYRSSSTTRARSCASPIT